MVAAVAAEGHAAGTHVNAFGRDIRDLQILTFVTVSVLHICETFAECQYACSGNRTCCGHDCECLWPRYTNPAATWQCLGKQYI